jgi:Flp pilus assembly protein TadG
MKNKYSDRGIFGRRRGMTMIYCAVVLPVLVGFVALAVDVGWLQLMKTELQTAADSSARVAAEDFWNGNAVSSAMYMARQNKAGGDAVILDASDIRIGYWDTSKRTFTPNSYNSNAVEVTAACLTSRGTGAPLFFARIFGLSDGNVRAQATAMSTPPINVTAVIPATGNIWLAGEPPGTEASLNNPHRSSDFAGTESNPRQSPLQVKMTNGQSFPLVAGQSLTFDSIEGTARHDPNLPMFNPDGESTDINSNITVPRNLGELGKSNVIAPINAVMAVFLDDTKPSNYSTYPPVLDFSTTASRNFTVLKPQLRQIFFVGDGKRDDGATQTFVVPKGATRLYMGMMDFYEWNNNYGDRTMRITRPSRSWLVK